MKLDFNEIDCGDMILGHVGAPSGHEYPIDMQQSVASLPALIVPARNKNGRDRADNCCEHDGPSINIHLVRVPVACLPIKGCQTGFPQPFTIVRGRLKGRVGRRCNDLATI